MFLLPANFSNLVSLQIFQASSWTRNNPSKRHQGEGQADIKARWKAIPVPHQRVLGSRLLSVPIYGYRFHPGCGNWRRRGSADHDDPTDTVSTQRPSLFSGGPRRKLRMSVMLPSRPVHSAGRSGWLSRVSIHGWAGYIAPDESRCTCRLPQQLHWQTREWCTGLSARPYPEKRPSSRYGVPVYYALSK